MKKILIIIIAVTIITMSCSKKENSSNEEKKNSELTLQAFSSDEEFKNIRSYNFTKSFIDNKIPYAQMICINPHCILNITDINPLKSKFLKFQQLYKPDNLKTESKDDLPTDYITTYYQFDEKGFIVKESSFIYSIFGGDIHPKTWFSKNYNLTEYGIETTEWEKGNLLDKYTIGFEKNFESLELKIHNRLSKIINKNIIENSSSKTTYYPDEEKYRIDYTDGSKDYYVYENGIPVKYTIGDYIFYFENEQSTRINSKTGEKERKPEVFEWQKSPCGLVTYKSEMTDNDICNYNVCYYGILDNYDDEFILLNIYMPQEKSEE